jgi:hypothetical protein
MQSRRQPHEQVTSHVAIFPLWYRCVDVVQDDHGTVVKWCGVNTDVDGRRRAEDDLRARERRGLPDFVAGTRPISIRANWGMQRYSASQTVSS